MRIGNSPQQDTLMEQLRQQNDIRNQTDIRNQDPTARNSALETTGAAAEINRQTGTEGQINDRLATDQSESGTQKHSRNMIDTYA